MLLKCTLNFFITNKYIDLYIERKTDNLEPSGKYCLIVVIMDMIYINHSIYISEHLS